MMPPYRDSSIWSSVIMRSVSEFNPENFYNSVVSFCKNPCKSHIISNNLNEISLMMKEAKEYCEKKPQFIDQDIAFIVSGVAYLAKEESLLPKKSTTKEGEERREYDWLVNLAKQLEGDQIGVSGIYKPFLIANVISSLSSMAVKGLLPIISYDFILELEQEAETILYRDNHSHFQSNMIDPRGQEIWELLEGGISAFRRACLLNKGRFPLCDEPQPMITDSRRAQTFFSRAWSVENDRSKKSTAKITSLAPF